MLITNTILLALYATLGVSAPVLNGDRIQVEHYPERSIYWYYPAVNKATETTATTKARSHVRRNNNAQGGSGTIGLLESAAKAIGIDPKSISEYLASLRDDFPIEVQDGLPTCLNQATRQGLSAIETSLSGIPKCVSDSDDEIEISTDGVEVDVDGLPTCLDKAGQDALSSIQDALNFGDCAAATPSASTQG